ncbi:unnamed protein product [Paramecium sonneborni]|uniref:Tetratricopeptide repeat protein n=1 Tax=Paramecium sonneborni TaxID=65129 RepID=A0A8S1RAZ6_9CILI|nr:unnamed protein product [Paramecium sonneborni]
MKKSNDFQNVNVRGSKKLRISNHIASLQAQQMLMRAQLKKYEEYLQKNYHDRELLNVSKSHPKYNYLIKLRNPEEIRIEKIIDQAKNLFISKQYCETIILLDSTTASSKNCQATILQHKIRALIILELFEISLVNIDNLLQIKPEVVYYIIKFFILYLMKQFYKAKQSLLEASKLNIEELAKFMNPLIPDYNMNQTHQVENENAQPKFFIQNVEQYITAILNFRQDRDDENFKILKMLNISVFNQESLNQKNYLDNFSTQAKQFCDIQIGKNLSNFIYIHQKAILLIKLRDYTGAEKLLQHNKNNNLENQQYVQTYAKFLYDQNALDESLQMWNHSLKIDPQNSYSHYFKGLTLFKQKNYEKALKSITKASQILPECVEFISCKAGVLLIIKQYEKAIQFYNKAISLSPKQNFYYYYKANCLQQIGKFEESLLNYDLAIEIYPWKADFYLQKGQALEQYGQLVKALEYYWKAIDLDSENEIYYLILARCLNLQNKQQEAKKILQKCLRSIPSSFRVFLELGALLLQQGNQKNAINSFEYSLKQSQNSSEISYEITKHLYNQGLFNLAIQYINLAIEKDQNNQDYIILKAKLTANINNPQKALDYIEQNIHVKQNNPYYFSIKGYLLLQQNKINEALEFFDKTLKIYPYESEILTYSAECLQKLGRFNESLERCNRSIQIKPLASSYNQKGITLKEMKRREEALDNYNLAIKMNPKEPLFYYHKGLLLFETSHYNNALQQYEIALQLNPELYLCLIEKCRTLNKLKLKNQALKVFEKVSQMSHQPQYSIYLFNYGVLLQELNLFEEALQLLCQATNQNQNLPGIFKIIVQSLVETNKYDEALSFVKEFKNNNYQDYHSYKEIHQVIHFIIIKVLLYCKFILSIILNLNNSQEALEAFEQSIIYNPEQFQSFNQIGVLLFKQKKYEDALKYFQDGLHRKPQSSTFYGNLAITLTKILQYENALKYIENAITLEPNNHKLINQKGLLLAQMGRRKEAIKFFQQNISQYPDNPIYYINRGKIINQIFQDIFWRNTKKNKKLSTLIKMKMQQLTINLVLNQLIWNLINNKKSKISILCLSLIIILELHYLKQRNMMKQLQNSITHLNWMQLQFNLTQ